MKFPAKTKQLLINLPKERKFYFGQEESILPFVFKSHASKEIIIRLNRY